MAFLLHLLGLVISTVKGANCSNSLLFERLSSKGTDPAAGLGIQRALRAAAQMQAFVSVRTAEFWLAASYAEEGRAKRLIDVAGGEKRARVKGTHWQILWPQP